jgi:hypothetical protein
MNTSFEQALVEVWRQALVENAKAVKVGRESYPVRRTPKRGLRQVDFVFDGREIRNFDSGRSEVRQSQNANPSRLGFARVSRN